MMVFLLSLFFFACVFLLLLELLLASFFIASFFFYFFSLFSLQAKLRHKWLQQSRLLIENMKFDREGGTADSAALLERNVTMQIKAYSQRYTGIGHFHEKLVRDGYYDSEKVENEYALIVTEWGALDKLFLQRRTELTHQADYWRATQV